MQPGQLITPPGANQPDTPSEEAAAVSAPAEAFTPEPTLPPNSVEENSPFTEENNDITPPSDQAELTWTASEFIEHQKPQGWYLSLTAAALVVAAVMYVLLKDIVTTVVIVIVAVMFGIVGARKPRAITYALSRAGMRIGNKAYPYAAFKSFSVIEEGAIDSIQLLPLKRFMPPISIYFPPEEGEKIVSLLSDYLPHEDRDHDPIDRLMKRMHF